MIDTSLFANNEILKQILESEEFTSKLNEITSSLQEAYTKEEVAAKISDVKDKIKDTIDNDELAEDIIDIIDTICSKKNLTKLLDVFGMKSLLAMGMMVDKEMVLNMLGNIDLFLDVIEELILEHDGWDKVDEDE